MKYRTFNFRYFTNTLLLVLPKFLSTIIGIWVVTSYDSEKIVLYLSLIAAATNDFGILRKIQVLFVKSDLRSDATLVVINEWIRKEIQAIYPGLIFLGLVFKFYFDLSSLLTLAYVLVIHTIFVFNCLASICDVQSKLKLSFSLRVLNSFLLIWIVAIDNFGVSLIIISIILSFFSFKAAKFEEFKLSKIILVWPTFVYILERNVLVSLFPINSLTLKNILLSMEIAARFRVGLVQIAQEALRKLVIKGEKILALNSGRIIYLNMMFIVILLLLGNTSVNDIYPTLIILFITGFMVVWNELACELLALGERVTKTSVISSLVLILFLHVLNSFVKLKVDIGIVVIIGYVVRYTLQAVYLKKFIYDKVHNE